ASAVRMQNRERISRARLAANRNQHAAAPCEHFKDTGVMRLKSHPLHRASQSQSTKVAVGPLQRLNEGTVCDDLPDRGQLDSIAWRAKRSLDQRRSLGPGIREQRQGFQRKTSLFERRDPLLRPGDVLKYSDREPPGFDL